MATARKFTVMLLEKKKKLRQKRVWRIRKKVHGTAERPRLCVHFSNKHIYVQGIDDDSGKTLVCLTSLDKDLKKEGLKANRESAAKLGLLYAAKALEKDISKVVFDRNGRLYHGVVKAFAEAARKGGLDF